jgi:hypothetical protein
MNEYHNLELSKTSTTSMSSHLKLSTLKNNQKETNKAQAQVKVQVPVPVQATVPLSEKSMDHNPILESDKPIVQEIKDVELQFENKIYGDDEFSNDCPSDKYNAIPTFIKSAKRVIAIGDIHGDYGLMIKSLKLAGVIDDQNEWVAEPPETIVVQVGDQIDSCRPYRAPNDPRVYQCHEKLYPEDKGDDMRVLEYFDELDQKARAKGGMVISLLGNHEILNFEGKNNPEKFKYVSYLNFEKFQYQDEETNKKYDGWKGRASAFAKGVYSSNPEQSEEPGPIARKLACTRPSLVVIGQTIFMHAGILPALIKELDFLNISVDKKLEYINAIVRKWILGKTELTENLKHSLLASSELSPFWQRVFGNIQPDEAMTKDNCVVHVNEVLKMFEYMKIGYMIIGHTPQLHTKHHGINGTCYTDEESKDIKLRVNKYGGGIVKIIKQNRDYRVYRVDGGFSQGFKIYINHGLVQVLEIIDDTEFNIIQEISPKEDIANFLNLYPDANELINKKYGVDTE